MTLRYSTDIVIFGGGVAGLWLLNRLRQQGYSAVLLEADAIGSGQTIASQGIIHGGLKYALSGSLSAAAQAVAGMPARWRRCLAGEGDVDLTGVKLLSERYYMWSSSGFRSRLKTFLGSRSLRGQVRALDKTDYPPFFAGATVAGTLYELPDFVIDTGSLLSALTARQQDAVFKVRADEIAFQKNADGSISKVFIGADGDALHIEAQRLIFSAGEGNGALIQKAGLREPRLQTRPLNMIYVKKRSLPPFYVHCIGDDFGLTPKLTVTSHRDRNDDGVWYLGGELAESGVDRSNDEQISEAKALTGQLFPWVDLNGADWHCFTANRAEAAINNDYRPNDACFIAENNVLVAWPTKLTLTPSLADKVLVHLEEDGVAPAMAAHTTELPALLPPATVAPACWD